MSSDSNNEQILKSSKMKQNVSSNPNNEQILKSSKRKQNVSSNPNNDNLKLLVILKAEVDTQVKYLKIHVTTTFGFMSPFFMLLTEN